MVAIWFLFEVIRCYHSKVMVIILATKLFKFTCLLGMNQPQAFEQVNYKIFITDIKVHNNFNKNHVASFNKIFVYVPCFNLLGNASGK